MAWSLRHLIATALGLVCALTTPIQAQVPVNEVPPVMVRFVFIASGEFTKGLPEPDLDALLASGPTIHRLVLSPSAQSATIAYKGPPAITLFKEITVGEKKERQTLATLAYPAAWRGVLFLVTYSPHQKPLPYVFTPLEFWGESIPEKHIRFYNFCPYPIAVKMADASTTLANFERADINVSAATDYLPIKIAKKNGDDGWKLVVKTGLPKPSHSRMIMLAYPNSRNSEGINTLTIGDVPMPPPPPAAPAAR
jgi:hypothetical protein